MGLRPRLTYANVVATLALFLALGGGAVWAAGKITSRQIGKGAVKSKNIAKGAVKSKNLAGNAVKAKNLANGAVSSAKLADGAVTNAKLGEGSVNFAKLAAGTNVIASATAGPAPANQAVLQDLPLSNPITVTPTAGQPLTLLVEARATLAQSAASSCGAVVVPLVNGTPAVFAELLAMLAPSNPPNPLFPGGIPVADVAVPLGLSQPGQPQSVTLKSFGDTDCTAASRIDQVALVVTQAK